MIKITVDKNGVDKLNEIIKNGIASIKDWSKPFKRFGVYWREEQRKNFEQQGAIYQGGDFIRIGGQRATTRGQSWQKLSSATRRDRKRKGYNEARPILVRTGELKGDFRTSVTSKSLTSENVNKLAKYHQHGTDNMPARRIIGMSRKGTQALTLEMEKHIAGAFKMQSHKQGFVVLK